MKNYKTSCTNKFDKFRKFEIYASIALILCTIINWISISDIFFQILDTKSDIISMITPITLTFSFCFMFIILPYVAFAKNKTKVQKILGILLYVLIIIVVALICYMRITYVVPRVYGDFKTFSSVSVTLLYTAIMFATTIISALLGNYKAKSSHNIVSTN